MGLASCLELLCNSICVEWYDPSSYPKHAASILSNLDKYDRIIVCPAVEIQQKIDFGTRDNIWRLPAPLFSSYHPDLCYLSAEGDLARGPLGHYHSAIAYAAFVCGLQEQDTLALYCENTYAKLGYFDRWVHDRNAYLDAFKTFGFDISSKFVEWSRTGPFMYTINHPKMSCLRDVAIVALARANLEINNTQILPHDNLANGPIFPVYPEIGARLGVWGSYLFKPGGTYQVKKLDQFVAESFQVYRSSVDTKPSMVEFLPMIENAISFVRSMR